MPILADSPPELSKPSLEDIFSPICVVCTKSRQEKSLAGFLTERGIDYYLPYVASANDVLLPMFSGCIFVSFPSKNQWELELIRSHRAHFRFLFTDNQPRLRSELSLIASENARSRTLKLEHHIPRKGSAVKFKDAALGTLEGRITEINEPNAEGKVRVFVMLHLLGQPVSIETELGKIEVV